MARNPFGLSEIDLRPTIDFGFGGDEERPRRKIDKNTRDAVWLTYIGNKAEGKCYCCRVRTIHVTDFQVGHNKASAKGGSDNISNLRPICGPCNRGMGTKSIEWYRKKYFSKPKGKSRKGKKTKRRRRSSSNPFGFTVPTFKSPF
ncbi:HNH endonuclease [Candidatus Micrarchaeota archaeon]|nr:HNH endonuclease [Candidatus Micrarchaeota archaeon]